MTQHTITDASQVTLGDIVRVPSLYSEVEVTTGNLADIRNVVGTLVDCKVEATREPMARHSQ